MHEEADETFAYLTFPKVKPENVIGEFLESKLGDNILKKYPEWDLPGIDPKVSLVAAMRNLHKTEVRLEEKKNEAMGRQNFLVEQWGKLEKEQEKFKKTFCEFNKMIEENQRKTQRAISKKKEAVILGKDAEDSIKRMEVDFAHLTKIKDQMEAQVKDHGIYESYLQSVVKANHEEFRSAQDVFNKYASLDETRNALAERLKTNVNKTEDVKDTLEQQIIDQNTVLNGLHNQVAELHLRYQTAKSNSQKWDDAVQNIQDQLRVKYTELLSVKRTCWNIYQDMCRLKRMKPTIARENLEQQLLFIKRYFISLRNIVNNAQGAVEADAYSVMVEKSNN